MEAVRGSLSRRLHSISGVVPIGAFLVLHLWVNASAARGAEAYNAMAARLRGLPLVVLFEIVLIALPIFFHGIYGLFRIATEPPGRARSGSSGGALAIFQRVTGVLVFVFVLLHLWTARLVQVRDHESLDLFALMQSVLANPWLRAAYVAGLFGAVAHFSAGIVTFTETWGIARGPRARVGVAALAAAVFAVLCGLGLRSLAAFRL
jgi:succinate dehydrogenase / fumarate reductase cytochrome b subunit